MGFVLTFIIETMDGCLRQDPFFRVTAETNGSDIPVGGGFFSGKDPTKLMA